MERKNRDFIFDARLIVFYDKQIVLIKWNDAKFFPGTHKEEDILECKMALFDSVGYLISKDKTTTVLAAERNDQDEYRDITLIPTGSIVSVEPLISSTPM